MLNFIRKSTIGIILAFVFMLSLFFFKSSGRFSGIIGVGPNDIAVIGDEKISNIQFLRSFDLIKSQFSQMFQKNLTNKEAAQVGLDKETLNILIDQALLKNEFRELKLFLDDTIVASETKKIIPSIYDKNNKINDKELNNFLYNQNLTLNDFISLISFELINKEYENKLIKNINYPESNEEILDLYENHERNIKFLMIPIEELNFKINFNNKSLENFYKENNRLFLQQEKRDIEFININKNDFLKDLYINDNEIINYYEKNIEKFIKEEERNFLQLNFANENNAYDFLTKIKNLKYLEIINTAEKNNIKYFEITQSKLNRTIIEISDVVFSQNINEISDVITSPLGYHIVITKEIRPSKTKTLNESRESIIENLKVNYYSEYLEDLLERIDEDLLNNYTINEIASKYNLNLNEIKNIEINNKDLENSTNVNIITESFKLQANIPSDLIKDEKNNSYFITNVSKITKAEVKKFEEIIEDVKNKYKENQIQLKVQEFIEQNLSKSLKLIGEKHNVNLLSKTVNKKDNQLPRNFINDIFEYNINELVYFSNNKDIYFGVTESIKIKELKKDVTNNMNINVEIYNELRNMILNEISKNHSIKINHDLINALINKS